MEITGDTAWIASKKGLMFAPKNIFEKAARALPAVPLLIKEIKVNDKKTDKETLSNLEYWQNRVEFNFEGVSLQNEGNLSYRYKLEGLDADWYTTKNRNIVFTSLPYGTYTFRLTVENPGASGVSEVSIRIGISAPFWKTYWFVGIIVFAVSMLIYIFFKVRILTYNRNITRELLRILLRKLNRAEKYFIFKEAGKNIRIETGSILYVKSSGNYIEVITESKKYLVRCKIGDFIKATPDPLEYIRIHRSFIARIDKVTAKSKTEILIKDQKLPVSGSYESNLEKIIF